MTTRCPQSSLDSGTSATAEGGLRPARFELKYYLSELAAVAVREQVREFVELDEYADPVTFSYPTDSLYLDSDTLTTFRSTLNGAHHRYKLRLRTYDHRPTSPAFFEVKRGIGKTTVKERGAVHRSAVEKILAGWLPDPVDMMSFDPGHFAAVEKFVRLMRQLDAKPKAFVRYIREAWVGRDDPSLRLTFDRHVAVAPRSTAGIPDEYPANSVRPFGSRVVLEMKFFGQMPSWFYDLTRVAGLIETMAPKYCGGVMQCDQGEFSPIAWPAGDPARFFGPEAPASAARVTRPLVPAPAFTLPAVETNTRAA